MESTQPALTRPVPPFDRVVADSRDRPAWLKRRIGSLGGSDAAGFAKEESWPIYLRQKLHDPFLGNRATSHGNDREAAMMRKFGLVQSTLMFRSVGNERHVATPDGVKLGGTGEILLVECKTSNKPLRTIPRSYLRQVWWTQYVLGAERTLLIWEHHENFVPVDMDPESRIVDRDDTEIRKLITIADLVLSGMDRSRQFREGITS